MRYNENVVTSVNANGSAVADFDMARFSASAVTTGKTGPEAKEKLKEIVLQMKELFDVYAREGIAENLRANVSVQPMYDYMKRGARKLTGYSATYNMVFHTSNLDKVSTIHDSLTNIEGVQANEPTFDVKNKGELSKEAFKAAFEKCQDRFRSECLVLGKDPERFEVGTWNVRYSEDDRGGGIRTLSVENAMPDNEAIAIHSGKADVSCCLTVSYVLKR